MEVLNQPNPVFTYNLSRADDSQKGTDIRMDNITAVEVCTAIKSLKNYKAQGIDKVPPELLKHGHDIIVEQLTSPFNNICNNENVTVDLTMGIIVKVPKKLAELIIVTSVYVCVHMSVSH